MSAYLSPTAVQRIRQFLDEHGMPARPWSGAREVLSGLESWLESKGSDPAFWGPMGRLMEGLGEAAETGLDGAGGGSGEVLSREEIEEAIEEIRGAMCPTNRSAGGGLLGRLAGPALAWCLALGGAMLVPAAVQGGEPVAAEVAKKATVTLAGMVAESDLDISMKARLLVCLTGVSAVERGALVDVFLTMQPEQIAEVLRAMLESERCTPAKKAPEGIGRRKKKPEPQREEIMAPAYKGVTFEG